jgi:hypothetical protein
MGEQKISVAQDFRACARLALEQRGFIVRRKPGLGVALGARLRVQLPGHAQRTIVVRVSKKRKIGITRHQWSGNWFEVSGLDEVIVVSPSLHDPLVADVYDFDAQVLTRILDDLDTSRNGPYTKNRKLNFPVFVALDPQADDESNGVSSNLIAKATWIKTIALPRSLPSGSNEPIGSDAMLTGSVSADNARRGEGFVERVRREYAQLNGVDVNKVFINIHYVEDREFPDKFPVSRE